MDTIGKSSLRAAVVGLGAMGRHHARICAEMAEVELVAVADPDPAALSQAIARHHTRGFSDYRAMLEAEKPDFVSLAVPTRLHYSIASDLIERGIHVLVEKPIAISVEEGRKLIEQARVCGVKLSVGHVERFNPVVVALKQHLDEGRLGRLFHISVRRISGFPPRVQDVGVAVDLATHDLDVMRHLVGAEVTRVSAETLQALDRPYEDMLCGLLRFGNGVLGLLNVNWLSPIKIRELMVLGERGMFMVNYLTQDLHFYENGPQDSNWESIQVFRGVSEGQMIRYPVSRREPLRMELESFVDSLQKDKPFPVSGNDGLQALVLAHLLVEAGQQGSNLCLGP
ncbi:Gfo/Idh/MocA family oxidoreductase [Chloroflexota bacterium]